MITKHISRGLGLLISATVAVGLAQSPDPQATNAALLNKVEELERSLAAIKAEMTGRPPAAPAEAPRTAPAASSPAPVPAAMAPAPADVPAAAVKDDNHTLGPLQFRGYSDLGFGRAPFEKLPPGGLTGSTHSFTTGDFDLFVTSQINDRLSFLAESLITSDFTNNYGAEMDRLMLTYSFSKYFRVSAGKFNTAIGYYTNEFHRARYFQTATGRPLLFGDEDNGGILPIHSVGLTATGAIPSGTLGLHWTAEIANGRASHDSDSVPLQNFVDENNGKAFNLALYARPEWLHGLETGVSFYHDTLHPAEISPLDQRIYSAHVAFIRPHMELLAEGVLLQHSTVAGQTFNTSSSYAQASYQMHNVRPYFRYEYQNVPGSDPVFGTLGRRNGPSAGIRYNFSDFGCFKVQYGRLYRDGSLTNDAQAQIAFAF
jgi:hypothetical protein